MMNGKDLYAPPRTVTDPNDCYFYHTVDLPGYGLLEGEWDLRAGIRAYLGDVSFPGQRVLEIGTASGFVCFHMESQGAEVVAYDLSEEQSQDIVPFARYDHRKAAAAHKDHIRKINNAYWLGHRAHQSRARVVYGTVYAIPEAIGPVDIATFGCVLLHVRDPFLALANAARLTRETMIVTEPLVIRSWLKRLLLRQAAGPCMRFYPQFQTGEPKETWWIFTPDIIQSFLGVLGFEQTQVTYHTQPFRRRPVNLFTVVGRRPRPLS
jgi:hypothetical protein